MNSEKFLFDTIGGTGEKYLFKIQFNLLVSTS